MNTRHWLIRLYPRAWRERYGDEFAALLDAHPPSLADRADILRGALDARLRALVTSGGRPLPDQSSGRILAVFCAYVGIVIADAAMYSLVDDSPLIGAMQTHRLLRACWYLLLAGSGLAFVAVVIGGLPIAVAVLRFAIAARRKDILLRILAVPALALGVHAVFAALVIALLAGWLPFPLPVGPGTAGGPPPAGNSVLAGIYALLFVGTATGCTALLIAAVRRSEVRAQRLQMGGFSAVIEPYRFALLPAALATLGMGAMLVGGAGFVLVAHAISPDYFDATHWPIWCVAVGAMAVATLVAAVAVRHSFAARPPAQLA